MDSIEQTVAANLARVRERIATAARRSGRGPEAVQLVAVSKLQPIARVIAALRAGVSLLGENYVQEAARRQDELRASAPELATPRWHLIGPLQRNKAKLAVERFDVIESLDRAELAVALADRARATGRKLEVLMQVNVSGEPQKSGIAPSHAAELLGVCADLPELDVIGLMAIPEASEDPESVRPAFRRLRGLRDELAGVRGGARLRELSMGMSADFEVAIEEGATWVRVGTALFGAREERARVA
jgi:pyridoxal phosphate enzyme (YggS family)